MQDAQHTIASDRCILRELGARVAEIAALPVQDKKRTLWRRLNALDPVRPMVMVDQVCWHEMDVDGALALRCTDPECRAYETGLRRTLFQWTHFPVDRVIEPWIDVPIAVENTGFGIQTEQQIAVTDAANDVVGHRYVNQFTTASDLDRVRTPRITHQAAETERRLARAHDLFDGVIEVRRCGVTPYLSLWDPISTWMGVEGALMALIDRPEFVHRLLARMTDGYLAMLDQLEAQGLLTAPQSVIHCSGAYADELPAPGYDPGRPRTKDIWMFGLAQMLATVSPAMFDEFEVPYAKRICERFGLVYYGCCDPLDRKMDEVRKIPNVRKVSISPWADQARGAEAIGREFVFSRKPNPALLAADRFCPDTVRADLEATRAHAARHGCPLEFILKDLSTVRYEPRRLFDWARIAMEVADEGAR